MHHTSNVDTVHQIYEAFQRRDFPAILARLAEDVDWEYGVSTTDVPWLQPRRGREGVAAFFGTLGAIDIQRFEHKQFFAEGDVVLVLIDIEFVVVATGKRVVEVDEVHVWRFNEAGQVARFRHRIDTYQHVLANGG